MRCIPMPLVRVPEAFSHPDWLFELKHATDALMDGEIVCIDSDARSNFRKRPALRAAANRRREKTATRGDIGATPEAKAA